MRTKIKVVGFAFLLALTASSAAVADSIKDPAEILQSYAEQDSLYGKSVSFDHVYIEPVNVIGYDEMYKTVEDNALPAPYYYNYY